MLCELVNLVVNVLKTTLTETLTRLAKSPQARHVRHFREC